MTHNEFYIPLKWLNSKPHDDQRDFSRREIEKLRFITIINMYKEEKYKGYDGWTCVHCSQKLEYQAQVAIYIENYNEK